MLPLSWAGPAWECLGVLASQTRNIATVWAVCVCSASLWICHTNVSPVWPGLSINQMGGGGEDSAASSCRSAILAFILCTCIKYNNVCTWAYTHTFPVYTYT